MQEPRFKLRTKILLGLATIVLIAVGGLTALAVKMIQDDKEAYIYSEQLVQAQALTNDVETSLRGTARTMRLLALQFLDKTKVGDVSQLDAIFTEDGQLVEFYLVNLVEEQDDLLVRLADEAYLEPYDLGASYLEELRQFFPVAFGSLQQSPLFFENVSLSSGPTLLRLVMGIAEQGGGIEHAAVGLIRTERLRNSLGGSSLYKNYILDQYGRVVLAPDGFSASEENLKPIITSLLSTTATGVQELAGHDGEPAIISHASLETGQLRLVSEIPVEVAFLASRRLILLSSLAAGILFLIAVMSGKWFADRLTRALSRLVDATRAVAAGDFNMTVDIKSNDETAALGNSFNLMAKEIVRLLEEQLEKSRMEKELETAQLVQRTFFPDSNYEASNVRISSYFQTASECGGDWWGHFKINERYHMVCLGDATGHGVPAALVTAMAYSVSSTVEDLRPGYAEKPSPGKVVERLNEALCASLKGEVFMTFFAALFDFEKHELTFSNCGHNPPLLIPRSANDERLSAGGSGRMANVPWQTLKSRGNPLGFMADMQAREKTVPIKKGDRIFIFSDGLVECYNPEGEQWGKPAFQQSLRNNANKIGPELRDQVIDDMQGHAKGHPYDDDITVAVVDVLV